MSKKRYDLIMSVGQGCVTPNLLRELCYRKFASPLDWTFMEDYENGMDILKNRFDKYFEKDDLYFFYYETRTNTDVYVNKVNKIQHIHCFPPKNAVDFDTAYENVNNMYLRRINRFFDFVKNNKNPKILLLYIERVFDGEYKKEDYPPHKIITNEDIEKDISELNRIYGKNCFDILYIKHDENLKMNEYYKNGRIIRINNTPTELGRPCKGNYELLKKVLKKQIGLKIFDYYVCSHREFVQKVKLTLFILKSLRI